MLFGRTLRLSAPALRHALQPSQVTTSKSLVLVRHKWSLKELLSFKTSKSQKKTDDSTPTSTETPEYTSQQTKSNIVKPPAVHELPPPRPFTLFPFFDTKEQYPGVRPAPSSESKFEFPVIDFITKEPKGSVEMTREIFNAPLRTDILHRVVVFQLDGRRQGTASTKTKSEVRGGGRKPWAQKGSGRARQGSIRAPHWRGGGVTFGPKPRDHSTDLPMKIRAFGMRVALSTKLAQDKLVIVDNLDLASHKTKELRALLPKQWGSVLIIEGKGNLNLDRASENIPDAHALLYEDLNVYDVLKYDTLLMTKDAVALTEDRIRHYSLGKNGREVLQTQEQVRISKESNLRDPKTRLAKYYSKLAHHVKEIEENPHLLVEAAEEEAQKKKERQAERTKSSNSSEVLA